MEISFTLGWWVIPTVITIAGLVHVSVHDDGGGYLSGIGTLFLLIQWLFVSLIAWIIFAVLK